MRKLSHHARCALASVSLLSACAEGSGRVHHEHDVEPLLVLTEQSLSRDACEAAGLSLSYVDDDSADRGRLRVVLASGAQDGQVAVEVQGAAPLRARLDGASELLTDARIQHARGSAGDISVSVRVELDCGAELDNVFVFEDPIARCATPSLESIEGREAELYECAERWVDGGRGCGEQGYLLGYGARYAREFYFETRPRMSARGKAWLDGVLVCLQHELQDSIGVDSSCDEVRRTAFDQHPGCYVDSGFCTLAFPDLLQIPATIDGRDLLSRDGLRQIASIAPLCGREYARIFGWWLASRH
jgi:hypothetical protein